MEINTRSQQIAKSSVYFMLTKMAQIQQFGNASEEIEQSMPKNIDLGKIVISVEKGRLEIAGSRYPANKVTSLSNNAKDRDWSTESADTAAIIGQIIWKIVRVQIYPTMPANEVEILILKIAREVWNKIDSWAI